MAQITHILSPQGDGEYSFCGLAFDSFMSGDHPTDDLFIKPVPGVRVTCPECSEAITEIRAWIKGVRLQRSGGRHD